MDPLRYYHLEAYLFDDVHRRFQADGCLSAFDFFSIIIWKANRAKTRIARRLKQNAPLGMTDLDAIVRHLTRCLFDAQQERERLRILIEDWSFRLPLASAVLTVLWPDVFTVYDIRVCNQLGHHHALANCCRFDGIWSGYVKFREAVVAAPGPDGLSRRDKDRYLWGDSMARQLNEDIASSFTARDKRA